MKAKFILLLVVCSLLSACDHPSSRSTEAAAAAQKTYNDQLKHREEQQATYDQHTKRAEKLLFEQEEMHKRAEVMLTTQESFMKKQADAFVRFEKIISTWEIQQRQYQKYLDSLPK
jgi:lysyl-tRNA synthetase class I